MKLRPDLLPPVPADPPVEFYRLPKSGGRDPYFGFSRSWYYKSAALGEIDLVSVRQRNALRGVRLVVYDSVVAYIRRSIALPPPPRPRPPDPAGP